MQNFLFTDDTCLVGVENPPGPSVVSQSVACSWWLQRLPWPFRVREVVQEVWAGGWCLSPS